MSCGYFLLVLLGIALSGVRAAEDLCINTDDATLRSHFHQSASPRGGANAGLFYKVKGVNEVEVCLLKCCEKASCNAVFFHNRTCYLITCNTTVPDACEPETRTEPNYSHSYLILVRTPDQHRPLDRSCEYGLSEGCERNEECAPKNKRARAGFCRCISSFKVNPATGWCESETGSTKTIISTTKAVVNTSPKVSSTTSATTTTTQLSTTSAGNGVVTPVTVTPTPGKANTGVNQTQPTTTTTSSHNLQQLIVSAGDTKVIQLPESGVTLSAFVIPKDTLDEYKYQWSMVTHPDGQQVGDIEAHTTDTLKLTSLIAGLYTFKVAVSAPGKYGEAFVNITVLPLARKNQPPIAIINPSSQRVNQPNDVILVGSESSDDDKIVKFHWEQVSGPLITPQIDNSEMDKEVLSLKKLTPGDYRFKLTVTDSDGVDNSTYANATVIKEIDYPPKASVESNLVTISLPQKSVTLCGNSSTDDKGIASYEWIKKSDDKVISDMTGVREACLHLENLQAGDYMFTLKVTDSANQADTTDIHVIVNSDENKPPIPRAGKDQVVYLPTDTIALDGTNSTDEQKITFLWEKVSGPKDVSIDNPDRAVATVSKLVEGTYTFRLTVKDELGAQASATTTVTVKQNENHPPIARAGGDKVVVLPAELVFLDGSSSEDDKAIVSYSWVKSDKSLAAGNILNNSDHQAVLQLTNLVASRYSFTLTVTDAEGLTATDTASLIVKEDINKNNLVELCLDANIKSFTKANKITLQGQLSLLLHTTRDEGSPQILINQLGSDRTTDNLLVSFYVTTLVDDNVQYMPGMQVVSALKNKLKQSDVLDFSVVHLDTVVCQNNCSGHGKCEQNTKQCVCEAFWMENFFRAHLLGQETNCDWSILYVIIVAFILVVALAGVIWGLVCLYIRWQRSRPKKRHRYTLLEDSEDNKSRIEMMPKGKIQSSSLMVSESDFSSDEETLFINTRKMNGHLKKNGLVRPGRAKIKT